MGKHKFLKRAAAGLLSAALAIGGLPGMTAGLLAKNKALTASAGESTVGYPLYALNSNVYNSATYDGDLDVSGTVEIGGSNDGSYHRCIVTIENNLYVNGNLHVNDGSYLFVKGSLSIGPGCSLVCDGISKVFMNTGTFSAYESSVCDDDDIYGTDNAFSTIEYYPDLIPNKDYFKVNGSYYFFNGDYFTPISANTTTQKLDQLCTKTISDYPNIKFSPRAFEEYMSADYIGILTQNLVGLMIDGDTHDNLKLLKKNFLNDTALNPLTSESLATFLFEGYFRSSCGYGTSYVVVDEELEGYLNSPKFYAASVLIGQDVQLHFQLTNVSEETVDDFKVVMFGDCAENGVRQNIVYDTKNGYEVVATVTANHICDTIEGQFLYKGQLTGITFSYSVEQYLDLLMNSSDASDSLKTIADSIKLYGRAAANYFDNKGYDISAKVSEYKTKYGLNSKTEIEQNLSDFAPGYDLSKVKVSLVLNTQVELRIYIEGLVVGNTYGGLVAKKNKNGVYLALENLTPYAMTTTKLLLGENSSISCGTWVYRVLTDEVISQKQLSTDLAVGVYAYMKSIYDWNQNH